MDRDQVAKIFMNAGFTIKEGQTDLKPYVYDAASALRDAVIEECVMVLLTLNRQSPSMPLSTSLAVRRLRHNKGLS